MNDSQVVRREYLVGNRLRDEGQEALDLELPAEARILGVEWEDGRLVLHLWEKLEGPFTHTRFFRLVKAGVVLASWGNELSYLGKVETGLGVTVYVFEEELP